MDDPAPGRSMSPPTPLPVHAWVDESVLVARGLYLLAAAVGPVVPEALEADRSRLRSLARATGRLHWSSEEERDKMRIATLVGELSLSNMVVTATRLDSRRQERARRKCLQMLVHQLVADDVQHVWLESRDRIGNQRDLAMIASLRTTGALPPSIRVDHARPSEEPLLWVADAVAGAVAAAYEGRPQFRGLINHKLHEIVIEL